MDDFLLQTDLLVTFSSNIIFWRKWNSLQYWVQFTRTQSGLDVLFSNILICLEGLLVWAFGQDFANLLLHIFVPCLDRSSQESDGGLQGSLCPVPSSTFQFRHPWHWISGTWPAHPRFSGSSSCLVTKFQRIDGSESIPWLQIPRPTFFAGLQIPWLKSSVTANTLTKKFSDYPFFSDLTIFFCGDISVTTFSLTGKYSDNPVMVWQGLKI